jgi:hypothetical protein
LGGSPARIGYSNGVDQAHSFELPGSAVSHAFLDSNPAGLIHRSRGSSQLGRYVFPVRSGSAPTGFSISGHVRAGSTDLAGTEVAACAGSQCTSTIANEDGIYTISGLQPGRYVVRALPAAGTGLLPLEQTVTVSDGDSTGVDFKFSMKLHDRVLTITGCAGGTATYRIARGDRVLATGSMPELPPGGIYSINVDDVSPVHGHVTVTTVLTCPGSETPPSTEAVDVFADPSGTVVDASGRPVNGATATILRRNESTGVFEAVPAGSSYLSPASPNNPETTGSDGAFGWDVSPGEYRVQASRPGCGSAETDTLVVSATQNPTGIIVRLPCGAPLPVDVPVAPPIGLEPTLPAPVVVLAPPTAGESNLVPIIGTVLVDGKPLPGGVQIPFGSIVDTTKGIVQITTLGPTGQPQTMYFFGGVFKLVEAADGVTELDMEEGEFGECDSARRVQAGKASSPTKRVIRSLWGEGKGSFRTKGRYSAATVRGTLWFTADRCDGTYTQVNEGVVNVQDLVRNKTLRVVAGHSVLVRP